jgi:GT2 family glycosyltransferase
MTVAKQKSTSKIRFSIVIVVRNDHGIARTLETLEPMVTHRQDVETIVVDASKPAELRQYKQRFSDVVWVYYQNTTGKRITIPEQRNLGTATARGDIIIFLDANCVPAPTWLDAMTQSCTVESLDAVTGPITSVGGKTAHDAGYEIFADGAAIPECGAANLAVRKDILQAIDGFDTAMSYGEDVDLAWRIIDAGHTITFKKAASIAHNWGDSSEENRRAFRYGAARIVLYKKHPHRWRNLLSYDINVLIYPLFILGLPVTIWFPFYPLLLLVPLFRNRKKRPIQTTFQHLIYGLGVYKGLIKGNI